MHATPEPRATLPPRPRLPRPIQAALFWRRNVGFQDWCRRRYGGCFRLWAPPWGDVVFIADPAHLKAVFGTDARVIHPGEAYATVLGNLMGPRSLFLLDEGEHLRMRRLMLPSFHGENVRRYRAMIAEIAAAEVDSWPLHRPIRLEPAMKRIALEVILRAVFGITDRERLASLRERLPQVVDPGILLQLGWMAPGLQRVRVGPWARHRRLKAATDRLIAEQIRHRRHDPELDRRGDVLSLLIAARDEQGGALSDAELLDELMTLLLAGFETTALGMSWAFERLVRHPSVVDRLRSELDGGDESYLEAVVKESLRARPVVMNAIRVVASDAEIGDWRLPAGTFVMPALATVGRAGAHHDDPFAFRPERFLDGSPPAYSWVPFGGGGKRCLGAPLATLEMKVVIATVLTRVELAPGRPESEAIRVKHLTTRPERGAEAVVTRRLVPAGAPAPVDPGELTFRAPRPGPLAARALRAPGG